MKLQPGLVELMTSNMAAAPAFYRRLGLDIPADADDACASAALWCVAVHELEPEQPGLGRERWVRGSRWSVPAGELLRSGCPSVP